MGVGWQRPKGHERWLCPPAASAPTAAGLGEVALRGGAFLTPRPPPTRVFVLGHSNGQDASKCRPLEPRNQKRGGAAGRTGPRSDPQG